MGIEQVKIRARIVVGALTVETPYVLSFNVNKQRGSLSSFSAKLKVSHSTVNGPISGSDIKIYAGSANRLNLIFTGIVENMQITPVFDDPSYVNLNLSGSDVRRLLNGKKFTRRCRSTKSTWVSIEGVVRETLKSGKFKYVKQNYFDATDGDINNSSIIRTAVPSSPKEVPLPTQGTPLKINLVARPYSDEGAAV
jgi:hypothetical protein